MAQEVYSLDLESMLSTLTLRRLSGTLVSDLLRSRAPKKPIHIEITLDQGKISSCLMLRGRVRLVDNDALLAVMRLGTLPWTLEVAQPLAVSNPSLSVVWIPKRLAEHPVTDFYQLSYAHYLVFSDVDGKKSVEEIAKLLRANLEQVKQILLELEKLRFISR